MHQRVRRIAFFIGVGSLVSGGLIVAACSTDNGSSSGTATPTFDGSKPDTSSNTDTGPNPTDGGTDSPSDPDCGEAPRLRNNTGSFFCAFYRRDGGEAGIPTSNCPSDETCCNPGPGAGGAFPASFCASGAKGAGDTNCSAQAAANGSSWPALDGSVWECNDKQACATGDICCMIPAWRKATTDIAPFPKTDPDVPPACDAKRAYNAGGSRCTTGASCAAGQDRLCSVADPCPTGFDCVPIEALFRDVGYCKQK